MRLHAHNQRVLLCTAANRERRTAWRDPKFASRDV